MRVTTFRCPVILAATMPFLLFSPPRAESASPGAPGARTGHVAKAAEVSTIAPETTPSPDRLRALAAKRAATAVAAPSPAMPSGSKKPTDVRTALAAGSIPGPAALEARRRAKETEAVRVPSSGSRSHGLETVLGPIPRPQWVLDLLGRQPKAASLVSEPQRSGAPSMTHVAPTDASVRTGTRGPKQPERSTIERGPEHLTDVELAKRLPEPTSGSPR